MRDWPVPEGVARRGSILLVHGLGEHSGRYGTSPSGSPRSGSRSAATTCAGTAAPSGARGSIPRADALLDDLRYVFGDLDRRGRAAGDDAPPLLLGHSLGGTIAAAGDRRRVGRAARADPVLAGARAARLATQGRRCSRSRGG